MRRRPRSCGEAPGGAAPRLRGRTRLSPPGTCSPPAGEAGGGAGDEAGGEAGGEAARSIASPRRSTPRWSHCSRRRPRHTSAASCPRARAARAARAAAARPAPQAAPMLSDWCAGCGSRSGHRSFAPPSSPMAAASARRPPGRARRGRRARPTRCGRAPRPRAARDGRSRSPPRAAAAAAPEARLLPAARPAPQAAPMLSHWCVSCGSRSGHRSFAPPSSP